MQKGYSFYFTLGIRKFISEFPYILVEEYIVYAYFNYKIKVCIHHEIFVKKYKKNKVYDLFCLTLSNLFKILTFLFAILENIFILHFPYYYQIFIDVIFVHSFFIFYFLSLKFTEMKFLAYNLPLFFCGGKS